MPVSVVRDLEFASRGGAPLLADLYLPDAGGRSPVIVWIHGGGWRSGSRRLGPDLSRYFAECGFAMVAVDYRSSAQARFPAQIEDLKTALRWLRSVAATYGLDATHVGLWGSSAGGHLAALAALTGPGVFAPAGAPDSEDGTSAAAVVAGYAPVDFLRMDAARAPAGTASADPENLPLPRAGMRSADPDSYESLLLGAPIETCPERVRAASPLTYVGAGAPPFLILHGLADTTIPPDQSVLLYDALAAHGNDATLCLIEGLGHGFLNRTHLDEAGARRMIVRRHVPGCGECAEEVAQPVFPLVRAFFSRWLGMADGMAGGPEAAGGTDGSREIRQRPRPA